MMLITQLMVHQNNPNPYEEKLHEVSAGNDLFVLSLISYSYQQNVERQSTEINRSSEIKIFDKFDLSPEPSLTNHQRIFNGSFSYIHRYSRFLTVFFSTST